MKTFSRLEHDPASSQMIGAIGARLGHAGETHRVYPRPHQVVYPPLLLGKVFDHRSLAQCLLEQFKQLARRVDVAIAGREFTVAQLHGKGRIDQRVRRLGLENGTARRLQVAADIAGETATCRRYLVFSSDAKARRRYEIDIAPCLARHGTAPEIHIGERFIGMLHSRLIRCVGFDCLDSLNWGSRSAAKLPSGG